MKSFSVMFALSLLTFGAAQANTKENDGGYVEGSFADGVYKESAREVRPSHLLNVETGSTLDKQQAILSAFGDRTRLAYGITDSLETRLDFFHQKDSDSGLSYSHRLTAKYEFLDFGDFAAAIKGTTARARAAGGSSSSEYTAELPLTLKSKWLLFTAVPYYQDPAKGNERTTTGVDLAAAVPLHRYVDAIVEYKTRHNTSGSPSETRGTVAGVAFKPSNRVTIPLVLANRSLGGSTKTGLVNIFAHVGFQF